MQNMRLPPLNSPPFYRLISAGFVLAIFLFTLIARDIVDYLKVLHIKNAVIVALFVMSLLGGGLYLARRRAHLTPGRVICLITLTGILGIILHHMKVPEERVHFLEFGILALLLRKTFSFQYSLPGQYTLAILLTVLVGISDEVLQYFLPSRYFDLRDIAFNSLAAVFAIFYFEIHREPRINVLPNGAKSNT